jgi:hypothetical protein
MQRDSQTQLTVYFMLRTQLLHEAQILSFHFLSYFSFSFWNTWWHYITKAMAHITCLYFYDMAISPVEHHTNITALAATQKTSDIATNTQNIWTDATALWTPITKVHILSRHQCLSTFFSVLCKKKASDGLILQPGSTTAHVNKKLTGSIPMRRSTTSWDTFCVWVELHIYLTSVVNND